LTNDAATALVKKLGIEEGDRVQLCDEPEGFRSTLGELPDGVDVVPGRARNLDLAIIFSKCSADLRFDMPHLSGRLTEDGQLWVAWPKRASGVETDLTFDVVQNIGMRLGMVDTRVCSIDRDWSGLRFVRRRDPQSDYAPMWPPQIVSGETAESGPATKDRPDDGRDEGEKSP
jgi:hypothetical protein